MQKNESNFITIISEFMKRELGKNKVGNKRKVCKKFDMLLERFHYIGIYDWSPLKKLYC